MSLGRCATYDQVMAQVTIRECSLDYQIDQGGPGTPLVWGHGLTSSVGIAAAFPLVDLGLLAGQRSVVRYDALGHGLSDLLHDPSRGSWAELAHDQVALIDHLGFDRVILGGVSMGAGTALHSALSLGERLEKLVLVIPPTGWEERAAQVALYEQMARVVEARGPKALLAAGAEQPPPDPFTVEQHADRRAATMGAADPARLAACLRGAAYADLPALDALAGIEAPTLVLGWTGDPGHPVSTVDRLRDTLPNIQVSLASTADEFARWSSELAAFLAG